MECGFTLKCVRDMTRTYSVILTVRKSHWWSLYLIMLGERSAAKRYHHLSLLSVVSKVSEKLVNNRPNDHPEIILFRLPVLF